VTNAPSKLARSSLSHWVVGVTACAMRGTHETLFHFRVASTWAPNCPQRGPYTGRGARTVGLVDDRTRKEVTGSRDFTHCM